MRAQYIASVLSTATIALVGVSPIARATPTYIALGDSITFGETDLNYAQVLWRPWLRRPVCQYAGHPAGDDTKRRQPRHRR